MRPIDANAICCGCPSYEDCKGECWSENECEIYDVLIKAPTLDYKDLVPQGEWKFGKNHGEFVEATCTVCDGILLVKWYDELSHFRFCPNCGARMKGGESE